MATVVTQRMRMECGQLAFLLFGITLLKECKLELGAMTRVLVTVGLTVTDLYCTLLTRSTTVVE